MSYGDARGLCNQPGGGDEIAADPAGSDDFDTQEMGHGAAPLADLDNGREGFH